MHNLSLESHDSILLFYKISGNNMNPCIIGPGGNLTDQLVKPINLQSKNHI